MKRCLKIQNAFVIPNGVDFDKFKPMDKEKCRNKVNFNDKKHILFLADPQRKEKNYQLAKKAFELLNNSNYELNVVNNISHDLVPIYLNAADVVLLTSFWEGSPNIIKEAMACNCPIVATDVGDVKEVVDHTEGCFVTSFKPEDVADKIKQAIRFGKKTTGRDIIGYLEITKVANQLISIYKEVK